MKANSFAGAYVATVSVLLVVFMAAVASSPSRADTLWSGFYFGPQAGYQWTDVNFGDPGLPTSGNYDPNSEILGVHVGYNFQDGPIVLGIEADIEHVDGNDSSIGLLAGTFPFVIGSGEHDWQGSVRVRVGYAYQRFLIYGTAGVALSDFHFTYRFPLGAPVTDTVSDVMTGLTLGAGVDAKVWDGVSIGLEYRYTDWGSAKGNIASCCSPPPSAQIHRPDSHALRARLSIHFNTFRFFSGM